MKELKNRFIESIILLTVFTCLAGCAQLSGLIRPPSGQPSPAVARIIERMPAENIDQGQKLSAELVALGPEAIKELCHKLVPAGKGDDNKARFALQGLSMYVSRADAENERTMYAAAIVKALQERNHPQVKAFLIGQLQLAGKRESVEPLAKFLNDKKLCEPATRALLAINSDDVCEKLLQALPKLHGKNRITVVKALGQMRCEHAVNDLLRYAKSWEPNLRRTALYSLANIGHPSACGALAKASKSKNLYERTRAASLYLLLAERLAEEGYKDQCAKICCQVIESCGKSGDDHLRTAGVAAAVSALGADGLKDISDTALRTRLEKYIGATVVAEAEGFVPLFNGIDLTGWKRHEGLPGGGPDGKWFVEDGAIVGMQDPPGKGGFLTTLQEFRDFELRLETKIEWPFDSGVFLRVGPDGKSHQVNLDYRPEGQIGRIYCPWTHGVVHQCPEGIKYFKANEWNKLRIICTGEPARIRFWLNNTLVTDFQHTLQTTSGIPQQGTIALQVHPGGEGYDKARAMFRNIFIRQIPTEDQLQESIIEQESSQGFVPLFNGKDLAGWTGAADAYYVKGKSIICRKHTKGNLYTVKEYGDFILRFEFKLTPGANNGLGIRAPLTGDAAYVGMELQILDNTADKYKNLKPWQYHGSIYGVVPAKRGYLKPVGEWNSQEVIAKGPQITVILNGQTIVDADIEKASASGTIDGTDHPGLKNPAGHIGFLGHGDEVELRNIRIKELK